MVDIDQLLDGAHNHLLVGLGATSSLQLMVELRLEGAEVLGYARHDIEEQNDEGVVGDVFGIQRDAVGRKILLLEVAVEELHDERIEFISQDVGIDVGNDGTRNHTIAGVHGLCGGLLHHQEDLLEPLMEAITLECFLGVT